MVTVRTSQNDIERFESLYAANYKSIYAYVHRRVANSSSDVSDIVSEVFTTAWRRINDVPPSPQDRLWLFGVAHKCLLEHHRRWSHRLQLLSHLGSQPNRVELLESAADPLHLRVRAALQELRPLDREVIRLVYWDGLSHGEAASVLGCSVNAVALRVKKAKVRLQTRLGLDLSATDFPEDTPSLPITSKEQLS
jgi:RNA polymerase sigma-70 factor (ECF subfamily)